MLFMNIYKNLCRARISKLNRVVTSSDGQLKKCQILYFNEVNKFLKTPLNINYCVSKRFYRNDENSVDLNSPNVKLPPLTDDPLIAFPKFSAAMRNTYYYQWIIKRILDPDLDLMEFMDASVEAMEIISHALSIEDYDSLQGLVANDVIEKLRDRISRLSEVQKELIATKKTEIFSQFPFVVYAENVDEGENRKAYAEVTMVYNVIKGLSYEISENKRVTSEDFHRSQDKMYLLNYRFRRDYSQGTDEPWIVTMCNHGPFPKYESQRGP